MHTPTRIVLKPLLVVAMLLAATTSSSALAAEEGEDKRELEGGRPAQNSDLFGDQVGDVFFDLAGRSLVGEDASVLYEEFRSLDLADLQSSLEDLNRSDDATFSIDLARTEPLSIEVVPAREYGLDQAGIVVMRVAETGQVSISSLEGPEFHATFADPLHRGRWVIASESKSQLSIRLIRYSVSYAEDTPQPSPQGDAVEELDNAAGEFEFDESFVVPSSLPDETWLLPDGSRAFSDEELAEIDRIRIQRNRVRSGSFDVVDVAVLSGGVTSNWVTLSGNAKRIINESNAVMINSSQPTRFRLVGSISGGPDFDTPSGSASVLFQGELNGNNGDTDLRLAYRDALARYDADIVVVVAPNGMFGGNVVGIAGHQMSSSSFPNADNAFFIIEQNKIYNGETVAHEIGHLFGGAHQGSQGNPNSNPHSFSGFGIPGYTIMWSGQVGNRQVRFSTPTQRLNGNSGPWIGTSSHNNLSAVSSYDDNVGNLQRGNHCPSHGTGHSAWVAEMYHRMVGTNINPGQTTFVTRLTNGINGSSPYGTAEAVQNLGADNSNSYRAHELTRVFRTLFGRVPDYGGYDFWLDRRWTGSSIATVIANFFASPEYASKHGGKTDTQFMTYLYQNGLGRNPDNGGLNWWLGEINDHGRQDVVRRFSQSQEAINHQETMTVVAQLYLGVLEKTPNANGYPTFVNRIDNQGWTPADVAREFMGYNNYWLSC